MILGMKIIMDNGDRICLDTEATAISVSWIEDGKAYRDIKMADIDSIETYSKHDAKVNS